MREAWRRVNANKGAPGVDRQDFEYIKDVIGEDQFPLSTGFPVWRRSIQGGLNPFAMD
jgi:hypothetical protein